jgi:hypothetical protein
MTDKATKVEQIKTLQAEVDALKRVRIKDLETKVTEREIKI